MKLFSSTTLRSRFPQDGHMSMLDRLFPVPKLLNPPAVGIDISDASIKWLGLTKDLHEYRIATYGELELSDGVVVKGLVQDVAELAKALREIKPHLGGFGCAHAALPEEAAYIFSMNVPFGSSNEQILGMIEFEFEGRVPIPPSAAVYDYSVIGGEGRTGDASTEIGVVVFPREFVESYITAFDLAGITLLSLETEARSIARAVSTGAVDEPITLLVDFGRGRTGFAVVKRGVPIFTSTVEVGGEEMTHAVMNKLSLTRGEAEVFKNDQGLVADAGPKSPGVEVMMGAASALADEVARHYHYWDTRRNEHGERMTPVGRVLLVGGSSNLKGLADYIAARVQAPTNRANVWLHVCSFDEYIPPIDRRTSLQYATTVGLALRGL